MEETSWTCSIDEALRDSTSILDLETMLFLSEFQPHSRYKVQKGLLKIG